MDYQQESRDFFGGSTIRMPMADFVREHLHLIDVLKHGSRRVQTAEARSQAKELKSRGGRRRRRLDITDFGVDRREVPTTNIKR